jgi:hypothetical protein
MINPKFRPLYLIGGFIGLAMLIYQIAIDLPDINPGFILLITIPDMAFFFLAYKTYPEEEVVESKVKSY